MSLIDRWIGFFIGVLLVAAPLFSENSAAPDPEVRGKELKWFLLTETKDEVARALGAPSLVAGFGTDFQSWQFQIGSVDHHDSSHVLVFRKGQGTLVSVTRNYEPERNVDTLFPEAETRVHHYPDAKHPHYGLRLRRLPGGRVLMAMGAPKRGQVTGQLVLMRESELPVFYPWLASQLARTSTR